MSRLLPSPVQNWAFFLFITFSSLLPAQNDDKTNSRMRELVDQLNHVTQTLSIVNGISRKIDVVADQRDQVMALQKELNAMMESSRLKERQADSDHGLAALEEIVTNAKSLESKLFGEVLLPHQSEYLRRFIFDSEIRALSGNVIAVLTRYYQTEFGFSKEQLSELARIQENSQKAIEAAKAEFQKKIDKIRADAHVELEDTLNPAQLIKLKQFSPGTPDSNR